MTCMQELIYRCSLPAERTERKGGKKVTATTTSCCDRCCDDDDDKHDGDSGA